MAPVSRSLNCGRWEYKTSGLRSPLRIAGSSAMATYSPPDRATFRLTDRPTARPTLRRWGAFSPCCHTYVFRRRLRGPLGRCLRGSPLHGPAGAIAQGALKGGSILHEAHLQRAGVHLDDAAQADEGAFGEEPPRKIQEDPAPEVQLQGAAVEPREPPQQLPCRRGALGLRLRRSLLAMVSKGSQRPMGSSSHKAVVGQWGSAMGSPPAKRPPRCTESLRPFGPRQADNPCARNKPWFRRNPLGRPMSCGRHMPRNRCRPRARRGS